MLLTAAQNFSGLSLEPAACSELFGDPAHCSLEFPYSVILVSLSVHSLLLSPLFFSLKGVHKVMSEEEEVVHKLSMLRGTVLHS